MAFLAPSPHIWPLLSTKYSHHQLALALLRTLVPPAIHPNTTFSDAGKLLWWGRCCSLFFPWRLKCGPICQCMTCHVVCKCVSFCLVRRNPWIPLFRNAVKSCETQDILVVCVWLPPKWWSSDFFSPEVLVFCNLSQLLQFLDIYRSLLVVKASTIICWLRYNLQSTYVSI